MSTAIARALHHHRPLDPARPLRRSHRLRVAPIRQDGPTTCTIACLRMVARYFGHEVDPSAVAAALFTDSAGCSYNTDLARIARRLGLEAECHGYNLYLNEPGDGALAPAALLAKMRATRATLADPWYRPMLESIVAALEEGVRYVVRRPTWAAIADYLRRGVPVIAVANYAALHDVRGDPFSGHDVLVTGYEGRKVFLIDPLHGAESCVDRDLLMFAIASRSAIGTSEYLAAAFPAAVT
jgi:hypothetical protein